MLNVRLFSRFVSGSVRLALRGNQAYWAWMAGLGALCGSGVAAYWSQVATGLAVTAMRDR